MREYDQIPVVWTKQDDKIVAVTTSERPLSGWTAFLSTHLDQVLAQLLGGERSRSGAVRTRTFTMRDVDLEWWDTATRKGSDGYSYGVVWGEDHKFLKNLQFKEVDPAGTGAGLGQLPPVDPTTMALAAALHQIQRTLERIEDKADRILTVVEWLEARRQSRRAAELMTAAATLNSVARRCVAAGRVDPEDLFRIGHLEQIVGTVHRDICAEIDSFTKLVSYTDVEGAKKARDMGPGQVADLVALDVYALSALEAWHQLMLLSKATSGRLTADEVSTSKDDLTRLLAAAQESVTGFEAVRTKMQDRSMWSYMTTTGIPAGRRADKSLRRAADSDRTEAQASAREAAKGLDELHSSLQSLGILQLERREPLQLLPAQAAPRSAGPSVDGAG